MKKFFIYFLSLSFLLMMNGFHEMIAEAGGKAAPLGEMISKGKVQFETRPNQWRDVEASHFMVFEGMRIRSENGMSKIVLTNGAKLEIKPQSMVSIPGAEKIILEKGTLEFRVPSSSDLTFKVGNLSITRTKTLQASKVVIPHSHLDEGVYGTISIHSNGAITIKSDQGKLTVLDGTQTVASLSTKDSITIPSQTVSVPKKTIVAQAGETGAVKEEEGFLGLSTWTWIGIAAVVAVIGGVAAAAGGGGGDHERPACP
jgi:uncharacterized GH25 family protein